MTTQRNAVSIHEELYKKDHVRILSINGGGVKGIIPALILQEIEKVAGQPIQTLFDYVVGTSVGGIIGLALSLQNKSTNDYAYNASALPKLFKDCAERIFDQHWYSSAFSLVTSKYSRAGIDNFLQEKFGDARFTDVLLPVSVFSFCENLQGPRFWSSLDSKNTNFLRDAAGATSAAPTYFPAKKTIEDACFQKCKEDSPANPLKSFIHEEKSCEDLCTTYDIDGGVCINNPVMMGYSILANHSHNAITRHDVTVVSIGTGQVKFSNTEVHNIDGGMLSNANIHQKMMNGAQLSADLTARLFFDKGYMVLNPYIAERNQNLDNSDSKNMNELGNTTVDFLSNSEVKDAITDLVNCLKSPVTEKDMSCKAATEALEGSENNYFYSLKDLDDLYAPYIHLMGSNNGAVVEEAEL